VTRRQTDGQTNVKNLTVQWRTEGGLGVQTRPPPKCRSFTKAEPNSQFRGTYIHNNLIRIWVSFICKLMEPLTRGLPPSDPRFLFPLTSTEFVKLPSPQTKIRGVTPPPPKKKKKFWVRPCHSLLFFFAIFFVKVLKSCVLKYFYA
jgi:hypothetical protein